METLAQPQTKSRYYRPELDVVRMIAFFLVFFHHTLPGTLHIIKNTFAFGLSLFFTLSAFLICELLLREKASTGTVAAKQFYIRRILRIWPLYYLGIALGVVVGLLPGQSLAGLGWYAIFIGCWYGVIHGWISNPAGPLWSISVEEQFYLVAPWMVKFLGRKLLFGFCIVLIVNASVWLYFIGTFTTSDSQRWANPFVQFDCFAAGILLCILLRGSVPRFTLWERMPILIAGAVCWLIATAYLHIFEQHPGIWSLIFGYMLSGLGSACVLLAFLGVNKDMLPGWAIYLGRISFGLYVYHEFAIQLIKSLTPSRGILAGIAALTLDIGMAALSYRYFEMPFLRIKKQHAVIASAE